MKEVTTDEGDEQNVTEQQMDTDDTRAPGGGWRAGHRKPWFRRRLGLLGIGLAAAVLAGSGYWLVSQNGAAEAAAEADESLPTATVARETLADSRSFSGTLGHGQAKTVTVGVNGIITGIADPGDEIGRGDELFRLNERPVTALYGAIPMYRDLRPGDSGVDAEQLIDNLTELGYADCEADDWLSSCVTWAIRQWQADLGVSETGTVSQTDVVFVPEGIRVETVHAGVGSIITPGSLVLDLTGVDQVVSLELEVRDRDLLAAGTEVVVELPGGEELAGTVTHAQAVQVDQEDDTLIEVEVTLAEEADQSLLGARVDVVAERGERENVLTVPVNALLALADGGHGVEVVAEDGTTTLVPVETGLFAHGRVEIEGEGISEGTVVGVAGR